MPNADNLTPADPADLANALRHGFGMNQRDDRVGVRLRVDGYAPER
jgi:hypothetical protein